MSLSFYSELSPLAMDKKQEEQARKTLQKSDKYKKTYQVSHVVDFVSCEAHKRRSLEILGHISVPGDGPLEVLFDHSDVGPRYNHTDRVQTAICKEPGDDNYYGFSFLRTHIGLRVPIFLVRMLKTHTRSLI